MNHEMHPGFKGAQKFGAKKTKGKKGKFRKMARKVLGYGGAQKTTAKPMGGSSMSGMGM